jgi:hypothetical protein
MPAPIPPKLIKSGGGNSSVTRTTPKQGSWAEKAKEAKTRPLKPEKAAKPEAKKPPVIDPKDRPAKVPSGGGNSSVTRTTQPQGSWAEKSKEARNRINRTPKPKSPASTAPRAAASGGTPAASSGMKGMLKRIPVAGAAIGFISDATPLNKGEREFMAREKAAWKAKQSRVAVDSPARKASGSARPETPGSYPAARRKASGTHTKSYDVKAPIPKARPEKAGKSKTRTAFEAEFAKNRRAGKKEFTFQGKRYTTKIK